MLWYCCRFFMEPVYRTRPSSPGLYFSRLPCSMKLGLNSLCFCFRTISGDFLPLRRTKSTRKIRHNYYCGQIDSFSTARGKSSSRGIFPQDNFLSTKLFVVLLMETSHAMLPSSSSVGFFCPLIDLVMMINTKILKAMHIVISFSLPYRQASENTRVRRKLTYHQHLPPYFTNYRNQCFILFVRLLQHLFLPK